MDIQALQERYWDYMEYVHEMDDWSYLEVPLDRVPDPHLGREIHPLVQTITEEMPLVFGCGPSYWVCTETPEAFPNVDETP